jgi:hypothetical protein
MNVKTRNTLILAALFAAVFGYLYFFELSKTPEQLRTPTPVPPAVFQLETKDVLRIEVRDLRAPRAVIAARAEGDGWKIAEPTQQTGDAFRIEGVVNRLSTLNATRVLTTVTDLAPFGFVTPTLEARLVMSDTTPFAITVGNKTPDGSNYYVIYTGNKEQVFVVASYLLEDLIGWLDTPPYQPPTPTPPPTASPAPLATETPKP